MRRRRHPAAFRGRECTTGLTAAARAELDALVPTVVDTCGDWLDVLERVRRSDVARAGSGHRSEAPGDVTAPHAPQVRPTRSCQIGAALSRPEARYALAGATAGDAYGWGTRGL